jgi:hypothetical protein
MFARIENDKITGIFENPQGTWDYSNEEPVFTPSMELVEIADNDPRIAEFQVEQQASPTLEKLLAEQSALNAKINAFIGNQA